MLEKQVEAKLVKQIKLMGGRAYKFISPGNIGVPDRIVFWPDGTIELVELKTRTGRLSQAQQRQIDRFQKLNCRVHVLHGTEGVDAYLEVCRRTRGVTTDEV